MAVRRLTTGPRSALVYREEELPTGVVRGAKPGSIRPEHDETLPVSIRFSGCIHTLSGVYYSPCTLAAGLRDSAMKFRWSSLLYQEVEI